MAQRSKKPHDGQVLPPTFGLIKTTLLDFPPLVAAVVFTPGCNLRCPWCQNPGLVHAPWEQTLVSHQEIFAFLAKRKAVLEGVVLTGGEPLFHPHFETLVHDIRALGYRLKLDTNGTFPQRLERLEPVQIDYVALDIKNAPSRYAVSAGLPVDSGVLASSLKLLAERWPGRSEVRLTWVPGLNRLEDLGELADFVRDAIGEARVAFWVQGYRPGAVLDPSHAGSRAPTEAELEAVVAGLAERGVMAKLR
jgi:pyruvate formate lyase activating enzyme